MVGTSRSAMGGASPTGKPRRFRRGVLALWDAAFSVLMLLVLVLVIVLVVVGAPGNSPGSLAYMAIMAIILGAIFALSALAVVTVWPDRRFLEVRNGLTVIRVDWSEVADFELAAVRGLYRRRKTGVILRRKDGRKILCKALSGSAETAQRFADELNSELAAHQPEPSATGVDPT